MRELKFRAWDEDHFVYFDLRKLEGHWSAAVFDSANGNDVVDGDGKNLLESAPLMQYTGRKDKNGKEIYEGDVLDEPGRLGHYVIDDFDFFIYEVSESMFAPGDAEVVGNIHENPEMGSP